MFQSFRFPKHYIINAITFALTCSLTACSNNEDYNSEKNEIVGKWTCSDRYYKGSDTFIFKGNNTYEWSYEGLANWFKPQKGTYIFNDSILTITTRNGSTSVYIIIGISNSSMVIMNGDGDKYTYYKE